MVDGDVCILPVGKGVSVVAKGPGKPAQIAFPIACFVNETAPMDAFIAILRLANWGHAIFHHVIGGLSTTTGGLRCKNPKLTNTVAMADVKVREGSRYIPWSISKPHCDEL